VGRRVTRRAAGPPIVSIPLTGYGQGREGPIAYIMAGDPSLQETEAVRN
jgi:hypothetical protein